MMLLPGGRGNGGSGDDGGGANDCGISFDEECDCTILIFPEVPHSGWWC